MNQAMERLATGLRINSAADDAAGLAISSKMTSQINGLTQAVRNAQDAMSMLATADGAMIGVTDMIQRMRELSIQAISDTNTDSDRAALNLEYQALKSEIDRIAQNTQWNGRTFFDGVGFSEPATFQIGSEADQTITVNIGTLSTSQLGRVTNNDYMAHASAAPIGNITASTFVSHGSSVPTADNGTSYASHASAAPTESAYHSEFINHASSAPTTTAGTGYATHASSVPTTTATSTTFNLDSTVAGPSAAATDNVFVKTGAVPSGSVAAGSEFQVNTDSTNRKERNSTTFLSDGGFVIMWTSANQDGSGYGIFGQRYDAEGTAAGAEFQVNTTVDNDQHTPVVSSLEGGGFVVSWTSKYISDSTSQYHIHGQIYNGSGVAVGSEFKVNTSAVIEQKDPAVNGLADGGFVVTWTDGAQDGSGYGIFGQRYSASGATVGAEFQVNTHSYSSQFFPAATPLADGGFVITWTSNHQDGSSYGIFGQRFDSSANPTGNEFQVNTYTEHKQRHSAVTGLTGGGFVVAWNGASSDDTVYSGFYGQMYDASGAAVGAEFQINTTVTASAWAVDDWRDTSPAITGLNDGGFFVTWGSGIQGSASSIRGQQFDSSGAKVGSELQVNTNSSSEVYNASFPSLWLPSVSSSANGDFVVSWTEGISGIFAQRFSSTYSSPANAAIDFSNRGLSEGDRVTLNVTGGTQVQGVIGSDGLSGLLTSMRSSLAAQDTLFSSVTNTGTSLTMHGMSTGAAVAEVTVTIELANSGVYATHSSTAPTPAVTQSVISTASAGSEFRVNTTTASSQEYPQTASLADGGYVVVWNSNNQDGSQYGVFGQRFNSSGAAVGGEFQANTYTAYHQTDSKVTATGDGGFLVTWTSTAPQDGSGYGVFAQRFNSSGTKVGAEFQVNTTTSTHQLHSNSTALSGGGFVITWASNSQDGSGKGVYGQLYDASGASVGSEFKVNTHTNDDQYRPSVAALNGGGFVVSWMSNNQDGDSWGVYGQRYDASGNTAGSEFKVNTHTTSSQDYPAVTSLNDGGFVVTWHDDSGHDGSADGVFGQRYSSSGSATGSQFQINSTTAGTQAFSSITSLTDGGFVATWTDYSGEDGSEKGIFGQRYDASSNKVASEFQINTHTSGDQSWSDVASLPNGGFIVTWGSNGQDGDSYGIYAQRYSSAITPANTTINFNSLSLTEGDRVTVNIPGGSQVQGVIGSDGLDALLTSMSSAIAAQDTLFSAVTSSGGVMTLTGLSTGTQLPSVTVGLEKNLQQKTIDFNSLSLSVGDKVTLTVPGGSQSIATYDSNGLSTLLASIKTNYESNNPGAASVSSGILTLTGPGNGSAVPAVTVAVTSTSSVTKDGAYVPHPSSSPTANVSSGTPVASAPAGSEFKLNTYTSGNQGDPAITNLSNGGFVVTWTNESSQDGSGYGVFGQMYNASGNTVGAEFQVNTHTSSNQRHPDIAGLSDGGFVVTWHSRHQDGDDQGIFGQRFDASGNKSGAEFQVNTHTTSFQQYSAVTSLTDGGFVVTWHDDSGHDGSGYGVFGQRYSSSGSATGSQFQINSTTASTQAYPSISSLSGGGFVATWTDYSGEDGSEKGIFGQRYDASGNKVASEFQINTHTSGDQSWSDIASLPNGGFVVTWSSSGQDANGEGVYAQRYNASGEKDGTEFRVNTYQTGNEMHSEVTALNDGGYVVTWYSDTHTDDTNYGIHGQRFDASGAAVGSQFLVNTDKSNAQQYPEIAPLADSGFVLAWQSYTQDGSGYGIYAQRFSSTAAIPAVTTLDFSNKGLVEGDRVTLYISGGSQVQGVVGSGGLDELLTAMSHSAALQSTIFSSVSSSSGVLTLNGLASGADLPTVTVALEKNIKQQTIDFSGRSLVVGDRITLNIAGGTTVQGVLGSGGLQELLNSMAGSCCGPDRSIQRSNL